MNPESRNLAGLFDRALSMEPPERAAFVDQVCGDDAMLRQRLLQLLAAHARSNQFMAVTVDDSMLIPGPESVRVTEEAGSVIGHYKLLERIGEGGGGVVYVAEQSEPVRRRVALKILKLGMDTRSVVARFEAERQALAMMDHPNIARVFDAGATDTGRPYFVMELVKGVPITEYCTQHHLNVGQRLELFMKVCHAIQHAHQKGVIHRDIKPTNVLVTSHDGVAVPKVIDFGIAKAIEGRLTDGTIYTQLHQFIGTPAYMSPEQAELTGLDIDTRSDIYSLGVLLYELLTGVTPFDARKLASEGLEAIRRVIREVEPVRPSTRLTQETAAGKGATAATASDVRRARMAIAEDLDWIVMRCLEKERGRRYDTANGLATDIGRHLRSEPIVARPPSFAYRFGKAVRRNRVAVFAAGAVAVALMVGLVVAARETVRAKAAERLAESRLKDSEKARANAEAVTRFMSRILRRPSPELDGRSVTVAEVLRNAVRELAEDKSLDDRGRSELQVALALTFVTLDMAHEAVALLEAARNQRWNQLGPEDPQTILAMSNLGYCYRLDERVSDAISLHQEVLAIQRRKFGNSHSNTFHAVLHLSEDLKAAGMRGECQSLLHEALTNARGALGQDALQTLQIAEALASLRAVGEHKADGIRELKAVYESYQRVLGPTDAYTVNCGHVLAQCYVDDRQFERGVELLLALLDIRRKALSPDHPGQQRTMRQLVLAYLADGRSNDARIMAEQLVALRRKTYAPGSLLLLRSMVDLATAYMGSGATPNAIRTLEEALANARSYQGPDHPETTSIMRMLADLHAMSGNRAAADRMATEVLVLCAKDLKAGDAEAMSLRIELASMLRSVGRHEDSVAMLEPALEARRKSKGPEHRETLLMELGLAADRCDFRPTPDHIRGFEEVLATGRRVLGTNNAEFLRSQRKLSNIKERVGDLPGSLALRESILDVLLRQSPNSGFTAVAHADRAFALDKLGRTPEAIDAWQEALRINPSLPKVRYWLARALAGTGRSEEALREFEILGRSSTNAVFQAEINSHIAEIKKPSVKPADLKQDTAARLRGAKLTELIDILRPVVAAHPTDTYRGRHLAQLLLLAGDRQGHAELCRKMLEYAPTTMDPITHQRATEAYLLARELEPQWIETAAKVAGRTLQLSKPEHVERPRFLLSMAMGEVRSQRTNTVEGVLEEVAAKASAPELRGLAHVFRAIHFLRTGLTAEGLADLEAASNLMPAVPDFANDPEILRNPDKLAFQLALAEATELAVALGRAATAPSGK